MLCENNGTLEKLHMTKVSPEIGKYDTHKNGALNMGYTLRKKDQRLHCLPRTKLGDFWKEIRKFNL